jgi:hypothetical protein
MASYSPSSNGQSNLPQSTVKYYDKKFRENLKAYNLGLLKLDYIGGTVL